jgi:hypothetical protein
MTIIKSAVAAALATLALSASAMTPIQDAELSTVSGQDGVSIAANLNINMDSFVYTDTDVGTGGSVSFNKIHVGGLLAASIDIISGAKFTGIMTLAGVNLNKAGLAQEAITAPGGTVIVPAVAVGDSLGGAFYNTTSDVVQIAIPNVTTPRGLDMSVASITMGGNGAAGTGPSFGSFAMNNIDLRGTTVWIWAH